MTAFTLRSAAVFTLGCLAAWPESPRTALGGDDPAKEAPKVTYEDDVQPILRQKCASCHNTDKRSGDLDVTNYTNLMQGGGSGKVVEPGDSSSSYLFSLVTHEEEPYMPPESPKIPDDMLETIRKWIDGGLLENRGSEAVASNKKKVDFALKDAPTDRPAEPPMPGRLSLESPLHTNVDTAVTALATSPWSPLVAVAGQQQVLLYHAQSLQPLGVLPFPEGVARVLRFSRNGSLLLAGGGQGAVSGKVVVWEVKTGARVFEIGDELDSVLAADISSDQTLIALGGPQKVVRIYSTETGQLLHELRKHTDWIYSLEFSPDGVLLATGDRAGNLFIWEGWTGREYLTLSGHSAAITAVSWRSDSNILASASEDGSIRLWEMENGTQVANWNAHGGGVLGLEFARDGRLLSCGRDNLTKLFDQGGQQLVAFEAFPDLALRATFCDETNRAVAGDWRGEIRVWNAADGARTGNLTANPLTLVQRLAEASARLAQQQAELQPLQLAAQSAQATLDQLNAELAAAQQKLNAGTAAAQPDIDRITALLAPATEAQTAASQAAEAAAAAVQTAQADVARWNEEIAFAQSQVAP